MTTKIETPRVWVGCLACYNNGNLVGEWFDADECEDATPQSAGCRFPSHEEAWCFDHEGWEGALEGEVSPMEAGRRWADGVEEIFRWASENGVPVRAANEAAEQYGGSAEWLRDNFIGGYASLKDYAEQYAEESEMLEGLPDLVRNCIDFEHMGAELRHGVATVDGPDGRLYLFNL